MWSIFCLLLISLLLIPGVFFLLLFWYIIMDEVLSNDGDCHLFLTQGQVKLSNFALYYITGHGQDVTFPIGWDMAAILCKVIFSTQMVCKLYTAMGKMNDHQLIDEGCKLISPRTKHQSLSVLYSIVTIMINVSELISV